MGIDHLDQIHISGDRIAKTQSRRRKKFGDAAQDDEVVIGGCQRHRIDRVVIVRKLDISFVDHNKNAVLLAHVQNRAHCGAGDRGGCRVVRVAEDEQVDALV